MAEFGEASRKQLSSCVWPLQQLMERVVLVRDISIVCGIRSEEDQNKAVAEGTSMLSYPNSKHNVIAAGALSKAVDIVPWPEQYTDDLTMVHVAGIVLGIASQLMISVHWGGNWKKFKDIWHFEMI